MMCSRARVLALIATILAAPALGVERPNIVYILADDLGYGDLTLLNPSSKIPTPNLDRLAAQGVLFTDAHTNSSLCTPTRYGLLTGRYSWRTSLKSGVLQGYSPPLIEPGRLTVASLLRQHGYTTACVGKWHLGWDWATKGDVAARPRGRGGRPAGRLRPADRQRAPVARVRHVFRDLGLARHAPVRLHGRRPGGRPADGPSGEGTTSCGAGRGTRR